MRWLTFVAAALALGAPAQGAIQVYNAGVDSSGTPLSDGTVGDPHYTLVSVPGGTADIRVRRAAGGFPIGPWLADDSVSAWIGPNNDAQVDGPSGSYDYRTSFTLPGQGTIVISGRWSTDNEGPDVLLNGVSVNPTPLASDSSFQNWWTLSIQGTGQAGTNTLDFIVHNDGGPTGLRVEIQSAEFTSAVPEPATILVWSLLGALGIGVGWWRRRKAA